MSVGVDPVAAYNVEDNHHRPYRYTLRWPDGTAVDLGTPAEYTVWFAFIPENLDDDVTPPQSWRRLSNIVTPASGVVEYHWQEGDLNYAGLYRAEFMIREISTGEAHTFYPVHSIRVRGRIHPTGVGDPDPGSSYWAQAGDIWVEDAANNFGGLHDVELILAAIATGVSLDHHELGELDHDDHLQYLNRSGVRPMTGDLLPTGHKALDLGAVATAWADVYAETYNVVGSTLNFLTSEGSIAWPDANIQRISAGVLGTPGGWLMGSAIWADGASPRVDMDYDSGVLNRFVVRTAGVAPLFTMTDRMYINAELAATEFGFGIAPNAGVLATFGGDVQVDGNVGINVAPAAGRDLRVLSTRAAGVGGFGYGYEGQLTLAPAGNNADYWFGSWVNVQTTTAFNYTGILYGAYHQVEHEGAGTVAGAYGHHAGMSLDDGVVVDARGAVGRIIGSGGDATEASAIFADMRSTDAASVIADAHLFHGAVLHTAGAFTRLYGIKLPAITQGVANFGLFFEGVDDAGDITWEESGNLRSRILYDSAADDAIWQTRDLANANWINRIQIAGEQNATQVGIGAAPIGARTLGVTGDVEATSVIYGLAGQLIQYCYSNNFRAYSAQDTLIGTAGAFDIIALLGDAVGGNAFIWQDSGTVPVARMTSDALLQLLAAGADAGYAIYNVDGADFERVHGYWSVNIWHEEMDAGGAGTPRQRRFGDDTNYVQMEAGSAVTYAGTARPTGVLQFVMGNEGNGIRLPATTPAAMAVVGDANGEIGVCDFDQNNDEFLDISFHMPAGYAAGTNVTITLIWFANNNAGNDVVWTADYSAVATGEVMNPALTGAPVSGTFTDSANINFRNTHSLTLITPAIVPEDFVTIRITRDANHGDDLLAADARLAVVLVSVLEES